MLNVRSLGSGSSGNALIVDDGTTVLLIDCGVPFTTIQRGLGSIGRTIDDIAAVLITHEHVDHVRALARLQRLGSRIILTAGTASALEIPSQQQELVAVNQAFSLGDLAITPLPVAHDAVEPCGFSIRDQDSAITIVTDTGEIYDEVSQSLLTSDLIILEANHDLQMLKLGPYPWHLKQRVMSRLGHLSNDDCASALEIALRDVKQPVTIWLAHLSSTNNRPDVAIATVAQRCCTTQQHRIESLPRNRSSRLWQSGILHDCDSAQLCLPGLMGV